MGSVAQQVDYDPFSNGDMSAVDPNAQFVKPGTDLSRMPHIQIGGNQPAPPGPTPVDYNPFQGMDAGPQAQPTVDDSVSDSVAHGAGLTARAVVQGVPSAVFGLPALGMDAYDSLVGLTDRGINAVAGKDVVKPPEPFRHSRAVADVGERTATALGLPEAETQMGRGLTNIGTAVVGAAGGAGLAGWIAKSLAATGTSTAQIMRGLAETPHWQAVGAAGGVAATEAARSAGVTNPLALSVLSLGGSMVPGSAASAAKRVALGAKSLAIDPFTAAGRDYIAGTVLNRVAENPTMAANRMAAAQPLVPGSNPTISQVSQDAGLIAAERPMVIAGSQNGSDARLNTRFADQNLARNQEMDRITMPTQPVPEGGTPQRGSLEYAQAKRNSTVDTAMRPAFAEGRAGNEAYDASPMMGGNYGPGHVDLTDTMDKIGQVRSSPSGAGKDVKEAMDFAEGQLSQPGVNVNDPETAYQIRKDLQDAALGKYDKDKPSLRLAGGVLAKVIKVLDGAIEKAAPGFLRYMELYRQRSVPLRQTQAITDLRNSGRTAVTDPIHGQPVLTMGKFGVQFRKLLASGKLGKGKGNANLSPKQIDVLTNIVADLDRGSAAQAGTMKTPGSDTFKNYTVANVIGRVMGKNFPDTGVGKALQTVARPVQWMYSLPDEAVGQILVEAALDPKLAARLMRQATKYEVEAAGRELAFLAAKQGLGTAAHNQN